jgi:hypothetical protein
VEGEQRKMQAAVWVEGPGSRVYGQELIPYGDMPQARAQAATKNTKGTKEELMIRSVIAELSHL